MNEVQREPGFRWLVAFVIFTLVGKLAIGATWLVAVIFAATFATVITIIWAIRR